MIRYAHRPERSMQPEAVPACFKATHDRCVLGEVKAPLRRGDFLLEHLKVARWHRPDAWGLRVSAGAKAELPRRVAKIERQL
jgi:hypothetical protein